MRTDSGYSPWRRLWRGLRWGPALGVVNGLVTGVVAAALPNEGGTETAAQFVVAFSVMGLLLGLVMGLVFGLVARPVLGSTPAPRGAIDLAVAVPLVLGLLIRTGMGPVSDGGAVVLTLGFVILPPILAGAAAWWLIRKVRREMAR